MLEYNLFCIYGFCVEYPNTWKIELDKKSEWSKGNVAFNSPKKNTIFVSWGPLEKTIKKFPSVNELAEKSINELRKMRGVSNVELVETKFIKINSHKARFSHVKAIMTEPRFIPLIKKKATEQEVLSVHIHCRPSGRYYIIYGTITSDESLRQGEVFEHIIRSFVCHKADVRPRFSNSTFLQMHACRRSTLTC